MVTITVHCPHCQSNALVRNGHAPIANSSIAAVQGLGKAVRIRRPMPIHQRAARRSCMPLKNAAVYAASHAPLASHVRPCPRGSKK
jgi:InsA N-terminal domain